MVVCIKCKGDDFEECDGGELVCRDCGTQVTGVVNEVVLGDVNLRPRQHVHLIKPANTAQQQRAAAQQDTEVPGYPKASDVFEAFQMVLQRAAELEDPIARHQWPIDAMPLLAKLVRGQLNQPLTDGAGSTAASVPD